MAGALESKKQETFHLRLGRVLWGKRDGPGPLLPALTVEFG